MCTEFEQVQKKASSNNVKNKQHNSKKIEKTETRFDSIKTWTSKWNMNKSWRTGPSSRAGEHSWLPTRNKNQIVSTTVKFQLYFALQCILELQIQNIVYGLKSPCLRNKAQFLPKIKHFDATN